MAVAGRKPKGDRSQTRHRVPPTHDWAEVEDTPYDGARPKLPTRYLTDPQTGKPIRVSWPAATRRWWETVSTMPHCRLWTAADWEFALETAEVHARFMSGTNGTELRIRQKLLGTTLDARRDLRIRYVAPRPVTPAGKVTRLDDYRDL